MGKVGVQEGFLVLFDQRRSADEVPWEDRARWEEAVTANGDRVRVLRL